MRHLKNDPKVSPTYEEVAAKHSLKPPMGGGVGDGWAKILDELFTQLKEIGWGAREGEIVYQIKERFGGLRVYIGGSQEAQDIVDRAAHKAYHTCEVCGKKGKLRSLDWIKTLCMPCYKIQIDQKIEDGIKSRKWYEEWERNHPKEQP